MKRATQSEHTAVTVRQPWAHLIIFGQLNLWKQPVFKDCENRSRPLPRSLHGRRIIIHAAAGRHPEEFERANALLRRFSIKPVSMDDCLFGYALGSVELHPDEPRVSIWKMPGKFAWRLESPWPFARPFRLDGRQGPFKVDRERLDADGQHALSQLEEVVSLEGPIEAENPSASNADNGTCLETREIVC